MEKIHKVAVMRLFNAGVLTMCSADWYADRGYYLVCEDGKVVDIVQE